MIPAALPVMPSSYLLGTTRGLSEWMVDLLANDYETTIRGAHGFGIAHPRASWLTLVVSSGIECSCCDARARWEERDRTAYCARCAEGEIAVVEARKAARS